MDRYLLLADLGKRLLGRGYRFITSAPQSDILADVPETADLVVSNPPFMIDRESRTYRNGGGEWGTEIARRIVSEAAGKLNPRGKLTADIGSSLRLKPLSIMLAK